MSLSDRILAGVGTPIIAVDGANRFIFANPAAEEFFRASSASLAQACLDDFADARLMALLERARQSASPVSTQDGEFDVFDPLSGLFKTRQITVHIFPLETPVSETVLPQAVLPQAVVMLQERQLARRLQDQQQFRGVAESMTVLSALLAHEIKNPLAAIRGAAELIADAPNFDKTLTQLIIAESDRIAALLTHAERLVGETPPVMQAVNIHEILDHCIALAASSFGRNCRFDTVFDPSLPAALGDKNALIQCFTNLLKNACEAVVNNAKIEIKSSYDLGLHFSRDGGGVGCPLVVEIIDYGCGINPQMKDRIFSPFITDKPNGTGLGLVQVAHTIASHNGTIEAQSSPRGSVFTCRLPIAKTGAMP